MCTAGSHQIDTGTNKCVVCGVDYVAPVYRMEQLRRAHASARPNSVSNPAWAHTHSDLDYVLKRYDTLLAFLCAVENVMETEASTDVAYKGRFALIRRYAEQARKAVQS